ncbi:ANTAR domain-containing protein [Mycolicibacterium palauense]|uniref:ANTAR domain-containing protein n=1 Tax=Mycolicibacterium palauense TaxID=2034511 RepID=UPI00159BCAB5|nr:ANTAR domain-containing protein [Mycolicibacterium palauense]
MRTALPSTVAGQLRPDARRTLCAAEGILVALRGCSLDEAFTDIVRTARDHNIAPLRLASALVFLAQRGGSPGTPDVPEAVTNVARNAWGRLLEPPRLLASCR